MGAARHAGVELSTVFGGEGRIGVIVPANNGVLEPEMWSVLPQDVALYATRILAKGDLTPAAVHAMEANVDRAVDELAATGVDVKTPCADGCVLKWEQAETRLQEEQLQRLRERRHSLAHWPDPARHSRTGSEIHSDPGRRSR